MPDFDTITIEEATDRLIDYRGKTPPKTDSGVRLVTAKVVKGGQILDEPAEFIAADFYDEWMRRGLPQKLDVLLTTEAPLGEVAVLRDSERIALAQRIILLRAKSGHVDPLFLFYALQSDFGQGELKARASGTTVLGIKQSELRRVRIPIFPLPVQQRIAGILSAYDELMENSQRRVRILEAMARALYREWFVHFRFPGDEKVPRVASALGDIPQGWEVKRVPECVDISPRVVVPREGEKPFVPMGCLADDTMLITDIESRDGNSGAKFQNGDTLFARITPCLENGKTGFVQFLSDAQAVACGSTEFIVLRSRTLTPEFVYLLARSDEFRGNAIKSMSGATGRQRVQERCFDDFKIVHPPRPLLDRFSAIVAPSFRLIQELHLQIQNLRRTRDLLLPRLLSGQVALASVSANGALLYQPRATPQAKHRQHPKG
jgi:type I restriction enzyme S subunit